MHFLKKICIGSRGSQLAVVQVDEVLNLLKKTVKFSVVKRYTFKTSGDINKKTALTANTADDFFTDAIDRAILSGKIDIGIHSAKDLPQKLHPQLEIYALTPCLDDTDAWVGIRHFQDLPVGARVGTSSFFRQQSIKALRSDIKLMNVRGTIQERLRLIDQNKLDGVIVATCALKRLGVDCLIKDIFPWEGSALQGQLAVVGRRNNEQLRNVFKAVDVRRRYGKVTLVGAGPGDPGLITVRAIEVLAQADCVFYDYLVDPYLLKYASKAEHIYAGKRKGSHALAQAELSRQLRLKAMEGKRVVRLKGGDPLIFGRGADEMEYLRSYHIDVDVVPGVSSATGIPSSLGIPLTARGVSSSVVFVSAHGQHGDKDPVKIPQAETVVFLMGLSRLTDIIAALRKNRWPMDTPLMVASKGTRKDQVILNATIGTIQKKIKAEKPLPPALIIVGKCLNFYREPVERKNILFLGTHPEGYRSLGNIMAWPMIEIHPVNFKSSQRKAFVKDFNDAHVVILTSEYAVEHFLNAVDRFIENASVHVQQKEFWVIGRHTAQALIDRGVHPGLIASNETSAGMFKEIKKHCRLKGKKILFPRSSLPNPYLKSALRKEGARIKEMTIYKNVKPARRPLPAVDIQAVIFTSPSTVINFIKDYGKIPASWEILCKGPVSQKTLLQFGYPSRVITN